MEKEIWKDVKNYEGIYQVSNFGRVKGLKRIVKHNWGGNKVLKEKILKSSLDGWGYLFVNLCKENKKLNKKIHIMVCESFLNHKTCGFKMVIDHIDSNKQNNNLNNLQIVTQRENTSKERTIKSGTPAGVNKSGKKYMSRITINGFREYLGLFNTIEEASKAYQNKLKTSKN
jgi:hypothetical protein